MRLIERLVQEIERLKLGLDPEVLAAWYRKVEVDAKARIRTIMNAALAPEDLDFAIRAFEKIGKELALVARH